MTDKAGFRYAITTLYRKYRRFDLVVDSRLVGDPTKTLFFALPGERRNGHQFVALLVRLGVRHFVVAETDIPRYETKIAEAAKQSGGAALELHRVEDPLYLLQQLAAHHRAQYDIPVVAVTGSNGKTIVKNWLTDLLAYGWEVCASPRSYNSLIGVPLSVWRIGSNHDIGVFEVGISKPGDMEMLKEIVRPTHGLLTTIGMAHLNNFSSQDALAREKLSLFAEVAKVVLPAWDPFAGLARELLGEGRIVRWSGKGRSGIDIEGVSEAIEYPDLPGIYLDNARSATAMASVLGIEWAHLREGVRTFIPAGNRLEQREGREGNTVINDSYSNDLTALAAALDFAETQDHHGSITLILGDVQQVDDLENRLSSLLQGRVARLILVGRRHAGLSSSLPQVRVYDSVSELAHEIPHLSFAGETVLVKGASYQGLDQIADMLSQQIHRTILRVNLTAIRHNFRAYRKQLPEGCDIVVMAKASAYGSGALPVARTIEDVGAAYLAVAYPEEGRALRQGGIQLPIMVLNAEPYTYPMLLEYDLEPVVHRAEQLRYAAKLGLSAHLELDTGMGRLGFPAGEFRALLTTDREALGSHVASIFTHLAASEDEVHDDYTLHQLDTFEQLYHDYLEGGGAEVKRHALNSNGISRFPAASYDMVRLGIGLYGIGDNSRLPHLMPALTLTTTITAITDRYAGETVGYGRRGLIKNDSRLAVLSIGYADGLPRLAGEGKFGVRINGYLTQTVGSICMDMCTVDITGAGDVKVGDTAIIFGPDHPVELLATAARTIPYEILTNIGQRVHRIYVGE